ncbi:hypothetical protein HHK36_024877 [Tetracentron sinense]|uniref:Uncharacterized protein n=1 Tax=Tetracentron sinense TaxID=13715 RepID=A0A834YQU0_TETSI|nr:hypothetical protein HHK36_024877 [Tetracentron sinense]
MALRVLLVVAVLLFCVAEVSSNAKIEEAITQLSLDGVPRGANRRLMQEIGVIGFLFLFPFHS